MKVDARGCRVNGASGRALEHYERALAAWLTWRGDPRPAARAACDEAPGFVMGHVLEAQLHLCSRDPAGFDAARTSLARARALARDSREQLHCAALAAGLAGDTDRAQALLGCLLGQHPRDLLALSVAHTLDHYLGETRLLRDRVAAALPAW
jgi:hypothetical protein